MNEKDIVAAKKEYKNWDYMTTHQYQKIFNLWSTTFYRPHKNITNAHYELITIADQIIHLKKTYSVQTRINLIYHLTQKCYLRTFIATKKI